MEAGGKKADMLTSTSTTTILEIGMIIMYNLTLPYCQTHFFQKSLFINTLVSVGVIYTDY